MSADRPPANRLSHEVVSENPQLDAPIQDISARIRELRAAGLPDEKIRQTVVTMFEAKSETDQRENKTREPESDEILVYRLPSKWAGTDFSDWQ